MLVIDLSFQEPAMRSSFPAIVCLRRNPGWAMSIIGEDFSRRYVACWECFVMFHVLCFEPGILLHSCPSWTFSLFFWRTFNLPILAGSHSPEPTTFKATAAMTCLLTSWVFPIRWKLSYETQVPLLLCTGETYRQQSKPIQTSRWNLITDDDIFGRFPILAWLFWDSNAGALAIRRGRICLGWLDFRFLTAFSGGTGAFIYTLVAWPSKMRYLPTNWVSSLEVSEQKTG